MPVSLRGGDGSSSGTSGGSGGGDSFIVRLQDVADRLVPVRVGEGVQRAVPRVHLLVHVGAVRHQEL